MGKCASIDCPNAAEIEGPGGFYFCPSCVAEWERTLEEAEAVCGEILKAEQ